MRKSVYSFAAAIATVALTHVSASAQQSATYTTPIGNEVVEGNIEDVANIREIPAFLKGNFVVGSGLGISYVNNDVDVSGARLNDPTGATTASQISLSPRIGYFLTNNFVLGFAMDFNGSSVKNKTNDTEDVDDSRTLFGPFARLYLPISESEAFFIGATTGFGNSQSTVSVNNSQQSITNNITSFGIGPGFTVISKNNIALDAQFRYNFGRSKNEIDINGSSSSTTTSTNGLDFVVGLNYFFGRRR